METTKIQWLTTKPLKIFATLFGNHKSLVKYLLAIPLKFLKVAHAIWKKTIGTQPGIHWVDEQPDQELLKTESCLLNISWHKMEKVGSLHNENYYVMKIIT